MKILILGATGFIGSAAMLKLQADGHQVTGLGRNIAVSQRRNPTAAWINADLANFCDPENWRELLGKHDVIVNCAGALQDSPQDKLAIVHEQSMLALYSAAAGKPVRIIQVSAPCAIAQSKTKFIETKLNADHALAKSGLDHVILRPAMVIGRNAFGGSALLRALAAFPYCTPLINADSEVACVHMDVVTQCISDAVTKRLPSGTDIEIAQSPPMILKDLVALHRAWLGLPPVHAVNVPKILAYPVIVAADLAGMLGWRSPLRSTAVAVTDIGVKSARTSAGSFADTFLANPASAQDVWFASLYFLKPILIVTLSLFWLISGLVPLADVAGAAARFGPSIPASLAQWLTVGTCAADILLAILVLQRSWCRTALIGMIGLSIAYLVSASFIEPSLWLDPLGPLVKVFPSIMLACVALAILDER